MAHSRLSAVRSPAPCSASLPARRQELCDFGFAVHPDLQYLPDKVRGTPKHYAPELRQAAKNAGMQTGERRSVRCTTPSSNRLPADLFSFGALIQEVVFGEVSGQQQRRRAGLLS